MPKRYCQREIFLSARWEYCADMPSRVIFQENFPNGPEFPPYNTDIYEKRQHYRMVMLPFLFALRRLRYRHLSRPCHSERSASGVELFPLRSRTMLHIVRSSFHSDFDVAQDDTAEKAQGEAVAESRAFLRRLCHRHLSCV